MVCLREEGRDGVEETKRNGKSERDKNSDC